MNVNVPVLDAERLVCFRVEVEFHALVPELLSGRVPAAIRDQLERATSASF